MTDILAKYHDEENDAFKQEDAGSDDGGGDCQTSLTTS